MFRSGTGRKHFGSSTLLERKLFNKIFAPGLASDFGSVLLNFQLMRNLHVVPVPVRVLRVLVAQKKNKERYKIVIT
jgi:hypothetical protein